jgi:hypothetical protein
MLVPQLDTYLLIGIDKHIFHIFVSNLTATSNPITGYLAAGLQVLE